MLKKKHFLCIFLVLFCIICYCGVSSADDIVMSTISPANSGNWTFSTDAGHTNDIYATNTLGPKYGNVGIGTSEPAYSLNVSSAKGTTPATGVVAIDGYGISGGNLLFRQASGLQATPFSTTPPANLGVIGFRGYNGSNFNVDSATIQSYPTEPFTSTNKGTALAFFTTPSGTGKSLTQRVTITDSGNVGVRATSPSSVLQVNGPIATAVKTADANNYGTLLDTDSNIFFTQGGTVLLPDATTCPGRQYTLKRTYSGSVGVQIQCLRGGLQSIDGRPGNSGYILSKQWQYVIVQSDGSNWQIINESYFHFDDAVLASGASPFVAGGEEGFTAMWPSVVSPFLVGASQEVVGVKLVVTGYVDGTDWPQIGTEFFLTKETGFAAGWSGSGGYIMYNAYLRPDGKGAIISAKGDDWSINSGGIKVNVFYLVRNLS